ncbi:unnamed protein product [Cylindrotheca closterium]|uniref:Uncharacterized protein n=1 Tax=Cylindrotheca closterium TaxID=2856 RepID=A0AAD2FRW6_9STRA|nr:unnamed protein product [Cylindrotheca closterium]
MMVYGLAQNRLGLVGNHHASSTIRFFPTTISKSLQDSSITFRTSCSRHPLPSLACNRRLSPLRSLKGSNDDNSGSSESDYDDYDNGSVLVAENNNEEVPQETSQPHPTNGEEVSYLMDDTTANVEIEESVSGDDDDDEEVQLLGENIGEDDMEQALAAGVVATLGNGNLVSEDVYLDDETGEIHEFSSSDDEEEPASEADHGGVVSGLFGNLRIPASLLAGASLGQAFALPFADMDGVLLGMMKRVYVLCMLGSFSSMLLTVLVSTTVMTDITLSNPRMAKSPSDYINRYYALDFMLTKINFFLGSAGFAIGSMLRGWAFLKVSQMGNGVLGIMGSFTIMTASIVLEYSRRQTGKSWVGQLKDTLQLMRNKTKANRLFGVGFVIWAASLVYLISRIPPVADCLIDAADSVPWWRRLAILSGGGFVGIRKKLRNG